MISVSPAVLNDASAIVDLLEELERFYGATSFPPAGEREADVRTALAGPGSALVWLARVGDDVVGLASCAYLWPAAGTSRSLFLKELYVRAVARRTGVGRTLIRTVLIAAGAAGCSRVEWQTESTNEIARSFYASIGANIFDGKITFRVDADQFRTVAS